MKKFILYYSLIGAIISIGLLNTNINNVKAKNTYANIYKSNKPYYDGTSDPYMRKHHLIDIGDTEFHITNHDLNSIKLPNGYVNYLKNKTNNGFSYKHIFNVNKKDINKYVNVDHMKTSQKKELVNFGLKLINSVRSPFGNGPLIYTNGAQNFADKIANAYNKDHWSVDNGHDKVAINHIAEQNGLEYDSKNNAQYYEDLGGTTNTPNNHHMVTMANLKDSLYNTIESMLFSDSAHGNGHALSLTGLMMESDANQEYAAISYDKLNQWHIIIVPKSYIKTDKLSITE